MLDCLTWLVGRLLSWVKITLPSKGRPSFVTILWHFCKIQRRDHEKHHTTAFSPTPSAFSTPIKFISVCLCFSCFSGCTLRHRATRNSTFHLQLQTSHASNYYPHSQMNNNNIGKREYTNKKFRLSTPVEVMNGNAFRWGFKFLEQTT